MPFIKKTNYETTRDHFIKDSDAMYSSTPRDNAVVEVAPATQTADSGAVAAIERLSKSADDHAITRANHAGTPKPAYKQRDFDAEARGKVKCVMFEAALQSPAIAGLRFDTLEEFLKLVEKAADAGVAYTWK